MIPQTHRGCNTPSALSNTTNAHAPVGCEQAAFVFADFVLKLQFDGKPKTLAQIYLIMLIRSILLLFFVFMMLQKYENLCCVQSILVIP